MHSDKASLQACECVSHWHAWACSATAFLAGALRLGVELQKKVGPDIYLALMSRCRYDPVQPVAGPGDRAAVPRRGAAAGARQDRVNPLTLTLDPVQVRPVQPVAGPGDRTAVPRRDAAAGARQDRALLLHVWAEVLLYAGAVPCVLVGAPWCIGPLGMTAHIPT